MVTVSVETAMKRASILEKQGDHAQARAICTSVLAARPQSGKARKMLRRLDGSPARTRAYVSDEALALLDSLREELAGGAASDVVTRSLAALERFPNHVGLWQVHGCALLAMGQGDSAAAAFMEAVARAPNLAAAQVQLGQAFLTGGKPEAAEAAFLRALHCDPRADGAFLGLSLVQIDQGRIDEAEVNARAAWRIDPRDGAVHNVLGMLKQIRGDLMGAAAGYETAVTLAPELSDAWYNLARLRAWEPGDPLLTQLGALARDTRVVPAARSDLLFALGDALDSLDDTQAAFDCFVAANAIRKHMLGYHISDDAGLFDRITDVTRDLPRLGLEDVAPDGPVPVFVLGMPRSGTTLVEQILTAHPDIAGGGELPTLARLSEPLLSGRRPADRDTLMALREGYLRRLTALSGGARCVTDKMPQNFRLIGLICAAFPEAKIVHVTRDPRAVAWSNFRHRFKGAGLGYSHDLQDIRDYQTLYRGAMQTWEQQFGARVRPLRYEALVDDTAREVRSLLNDLQVDFHAACLLPEDNRRAVRTASNTQIRKPIDARLKSGWTRYAPYLGPIMTKMG